MENLIDLDGIGEIQIESINSFFLSNTNIEIVRQLIDKLKIKNFKISNKIKYINKKSDLTSVIKFLQDGYKWSRKRSNEIKKHLKYQEGNVPMGAYRKENGKFKAKLCLINL